MHESILRFSYALRMRKLQVDLRFDACFLPSKRQEDETKMLVVVIRMLRVVAPCGRIHHLFDERLKACHSRAYSTPASSKDEEVDNQQAGKSCDLLPPLSHVCFLSRSPLSFLSTHTPYPFAYRNPRVVGVWACVLSMSSMTISPRLQAREMARREEVRSCWFQPPG